MKKAITIMLSLVIMASLACAGTSAAVIFTDTFDTWSDFWFGEDGSAFRIRDVKGNKMLEGEPQAVVHQSFFEGDDVRGYGPLPCKSVITTGTFWVDCYIETWDNENGGVGLWYMNYAPEDDGKEMINYTLKYYPKDSTVIFYCNDEALDLPEGEKAEGDNDPHNLVKYEVPGAPGDNLRSMKPVTLGIRLDMGKISAFVNGVCIGSREDPTIGKIPSPMLLWNENNHVYFDNFNVGDLDELPLTAPTPDPNPAPNPEPGPNPTPGPVNTDTPTQIADVTDDSGNVVTDADGNKVTQIVHVPTADTNKGGSSASAGGAQTGDMAAAVAAVMIISLGAAIVVKKVCSAR